MTGLSSALTCSRRPSSGYICLLPNPKEPSTTSLLYSGQKRQYKSLRS